MNTKSDDDDKQKNEPPLLTESASSSSTSPPSSPSSSSSSSSSPSSSTTPSQTSSSSSSSSTSSSPSPSAAVSTTTTTTTTASVLTKSRHELWNTRLSPGGYLDAMRKWCIDPTLQFWSILLAPVQHNRFLDIITARIMQICFIVPLMWSLAIMVATTTTTATPVNHVAQEQDQDDDNARLTAKQDLLLQASPTGSRPWSSSSSSSSSSSLFMIAPPSDTYSALQGAMAFMVTATTDLFGALLDAQHMNKWWQAIVAFSNYLHASGMSAHLQESIVKPLTRGRLFCNIKILNDIQEEIRSNNDLLQAPAPRQQVEKQQPKEDHQPDDQKNINVELLLKEAGRMMRFATAAYGRNMVASAIDREVSWEHMNTEKKAICVHTGLQSVDDIPLLVEGQGMNVLRHYIAIDATSKSVVLAIRGTLDLSGALVDVQGMDCDFACLPPYGRAHQGIAEQAENIWTASGDKLQQILNGTGTTAADSNTTTAVVPKDYRLIITGHSLGAGAACLLHLKIHAENIFPGRTVLCYGFAPPPTFALHCPPEDEENEQDGRDHAARAATINMSRRQLQKAMDHAYCFIHDNDCVPFLSVASVQRLSTLLDTVDNHTEHLWSWQRFKIFWEWTKIPPDIIQAVQAVMKQKNSSSSSSSSAGAATDLQAETAKKDDAMTNTATTATAATTVQHQHVSLMIPASTVIWMKKQKDSSFQAIPCCPTLLSQLDIFMCPDMLSDHLPEQYEDALDALKGTTAVAATAVTTTTTTTATNINMQ